MRAAVNEIYGPPDVVKVTEIPRPVPGAGDVLVRVHSVAVTAADARLRAARFPRGFGLVGRLAFGIRRPRTKTLGSALSGVIESVGPNVSGMKPGDEVSGMTGARMGGHAEYAIAKSTQLVVKPATVSHDDAAAVLFGGSTALHYLREKAALRPGMSVLVVGASGAVGTNAVQLAHHLGARVTGVTSSPNVALVSNLGATEVLDYTMSPLDSITGRFDVVFDTVGALTPASGRTLLAKGGVLLLAVADVSQMLFSERRVKAGPAPEKPAVFSELLALVAEGSLRAVVESTHPLDDIADAHRRVDSGRKVGNIIVNP